MKPTIVIGFLGTQLDAGSGSGRWEKWRPTVALGMFEDLLVHRIELLVDAFKWGRLAEQVKNDVHAQSPDTGVVVHDLRLEDPWDFGGVYARMFEFVRGYQFEADKCGYLVQKLPHTFAKDALETTSYLKSGNANRPAITH